MAEYFARARTNYVRFDDVAEVQAICDHLGYELVKRTHQDQEQCAILCPNGWDTLTSLPDVEHEVDLLDALSEYLIDGDVLVVVESGYMKLASIGGWATAINAQGQRISLDLRDIYQLAKELATSPITFAED